MMQLRIIPIEKTKFVKLFSTAPASDKKWLISVFHNTVMIPKFYIVKEIKSQKTIGLIYSIELKELKDFSLMIFPQFQRKGLGEELILHLLKNYENASFTVSRSNNRMLKLLDKVSLIKRLSVKDTDWKSLQFKQWKN